MSTYTEQHIRDKLIKGLDATHVVSLFCFCFPLPLSPVKLCDLTSKMELPSEVWLCIFGVLVSVLLRCTTGLHPYSGAGKPPLYGDYEAQRHWMEITTNLPLDEWYHNTTRNDLMYWGLDYPPLTAYHMYFCGLVARLLNPEFVALEKSRGYESEAHKLFMRYSVLLADVLLYVPAVILFFMCCPDTGTACSVRRNQGALPKKKKEDTREVDVLQRSLAIILTLLYPGLILIDHGHFQYNCISLAFLIYALIFLLRGRHLFASLFFCFALNYKQMELYHALPFFLYLLSSCVPKPGCTLTSGVVQLTKISLTVLLTFAVIWSPFLFKFENVVQLVRRLFPVDRGIFEDKVANVWCALNVVFKFKQRFSNETMVRYCLMATLSAIFPSSVDLFLRPSSKKFLLSLINSSLAFFLFSFQVHEKSVLLVAIPVVLYLPKQPFVCFWFVVVSIFSMLPLFVKDDLVVAFVALTGFYVTSFFVCITYSMRNGFVQFYRNLVKSVFDVRFAKNDIVYLFRTIARHLSKNYDSVTVLMLHLFMYLSFLGCFIIMFAYSFFKPPERYPDLFVLLVSVYSCVHFVGFFVYFNVVQLRIPQDFDYGKIKLS